ncbi:hypothetical protein [Streptomyces sp. NPDC048663]|uniref:hypothetical protein n=1 Tax=Streptomyces sp. NPDC048663 TaxID=3155638 RepID=UPI0034436E96
MTEEPVTVTGITPGLTIREVTGCDQRRFAVADWLCACGHHERAQGPANVISLAARVRVGTAHDGRCTDPLERLLLEARPKGAA